MFYNFNAERLPHITQIYSAARNSGWIMAETTNLLVYILEGSCTFEINGIIYNMEKDNLIFIPANCSYIRRHEKNEWCTFLYIHFAMDSEVKIFSKNEAVLFLNEFKEHSDNALLGQNENFNDKQFLIYNFINFEQNKKQIKDCIDNLIHHMKNRYLESALISSIDLWRILSIMTQTTIGLMISMDEINPTRNIPREIKDIILYIQNHYHSHISLDELCRHSKLSKQQLIRAFKKYLHTTPATYILDTKISHAKALLMSDSNLSIKEIANEIGFTDQHYFCRIFKKKIGETPSDYKKYKTELDNIVQSGMLPPDILDTSS